MKSDTILEKHPETEEGYWASIEALGAYIYTTQRGVAKGHIDDSTNISGDTNKFRDLQKSLVWELYEKFGILPPESYKAPNGKSADHKKPDAKPYWDWYNEQKKAFYEKEYATIICSACPFSEGSEILSRRIPCSVFSGSMFQLTHSHLCGMVDFEFWKRETLLSKIKEKAGEGGLQKFLDKEADLKSEQKSETVTQ